MMNVNNWIKPDLQTNLEVKAKGVIHEGFCVAAKELQFMIMAY